MTEKEELERYRKMFQHVIADKTGLYFICGEGGDKDEYGLPEFIHICPALGADLSLTSTYKKV